MNKFRKLISIFLILNIFFASIPNVFAKTISESDTINLVHDHDCISVLKIKGKDMLKGVAYICYKDEETKNKYPAFCVEPEKIGIGTGAGENYDVTLNKLDNPILWRILYKGYVGSSYLDWDLEEDDDLYYATKTAVHCFVDEVSPVEKYEVPHRVGYGENVELDEVQRRGKSVLEVAQKLYEYGYNGTENYVKSIINIKEKEQTQETIEKVKYLIQNYEVVSNKELSSYEVDIKDFPEGTKILDDSNKTNSKMVKSTFKIAIPINKIKDNFKGTINIKNAIVKSYPIFYGESEDSNMQDYVLIEKNEVSSSKTELSINAYKSSIKLVKLDNESKLPIQNAEFNFKYEDGKNIGNFVTDSNGEIVIKNLKQGNIIVTELNVDEKYILDNTPQKINLEYGQIKEIEIENKRKKGQIEILKTSSNENKITGDKEGSPIEGARFGIYNEEGKIIEEITTNEKGRALSKKLDVGKYTVKELETSKWYILEENKTDIEINENQEIIKIELTNKSKKPEVDIKKRAPQIVKQDKEIKYDFEIKNTGNVKLNNFTWYDFLPYENANITKIQTGTYNQKLNYNIYYKTNKKEEYLVLKTDLKSNENTSIDLTKIYLEEGECITEIKAQFGNVEKGFASVEKPLIYIQAIENIEDGMVLKNETVLEGMHQNYKVCDEDKTETIVENKKEIIKKLPRTGY